MGSNYWRSYKFYLFIACIRAASRIDVLSWIETIFKRSLCFDISDVPGPATINDSFLIVSFI